jgi:hypothetical protein
VMLCRIVLLCSLLILVAFAASAQDKAPANKAPSLRTTAAAGSRHTCTIVRPATV